MKKTIQRTTMLNITLDRDEFKKAVGIPLKFKITDFTIDDDDEVNNLKCAIFARFKAVKMSKEELKERKRYLSAM